MGSIKKALHICSGYLWIECKVFRTYFMIIVMLVLSHMCMEEIIQFSYTTKYRITPWGYVFFTTTRFVRLAFALIFLVLVCNLPFRRENDQFFLVRCGRKAFCLGNICYAFVNACLYTLLSAVMGFIWGFPKVEWSMKWGKIFGTLAMTDAGSGFLNSVRISTKLVQREEPIKMMLCAIFLSVCCYFFFGLVMIICNLLQRRRNIGTFVCGFFVLWDFFVQTEPVFWRAAYISPVSWSNLANLDIRKNTTVFPSLTYAVTGYLVMITVLVILIMVNSSRLHICEELS